MALEIKVLLVEDDKDLRDSVVEWLELDGMQVTAARNAAEFYQAMVQNNFHVAVIDIGLPDQEGYVLAEYVRANTPMGVIILTARSSIEDKLKGYQAGADHYLVKPVDCRELSAVISGIALRMENVSIELPLAPKNCCDWCVYPTQWALAYAQHPPVKLNLKELLLLELLATQPGVLVQKRAILIKLYQRDDHYSSRSLDSVVRRLRAKILAQVGVDIPIRTVHSVGYSFAGEIAIDETEPL